MQPVMDTICFGTGHVRCQSATQITVVIAVRVLREAVIVTMTVNVQVI
jgi:hypothetical protein